MNQKVGVGKKTKQRTHKKKEKSGLKLNYFKLSKQIDTILNQLDTYQNNLTNNNKKARNNIRSMKSKYSISLKSNQTNSEAINSYITTLTDQLSTLKQILNKYRNPSTNVPPPSQPESLKITTKQNEKQNKPLLNEEFARIHQQIKLLEKMLQQFDDTLYGRTPQTTSTAV